MPPSTSSYLSDSEILEKISENKSARAIQEKISGKDHGLDTFTYHRFADALEIVGRILAYADNAQYNKVQTKDLAQAVVASLTRVANIWMPRTLEHNLGLEPSLKLFFRVLYEIEETLNRQARQGVLRRRLNRSENLEELKRLDVGLSQALSYFLMVSNFPVRGQEENVPQKSTPSALNSVQDLSDVLTSAWTAVWDSLVSPAGCLEGTRVDVIERFVSWTRKPESGLSMYWLVGHAGTGKSAIAKSICEQITKHDNTVLLSFFASKSSQERSSPLHVLHSFLYQLAAVDNNFLRTLRSNLPANQDISQWSFSDQVNRLLKTTLVATYGSCERPRLVVVVDALDEFGMVNGMDGQSLITYLIAALHELPLKLIVTSRLETQLMDTYRALYLNKSILDLNRFPEAVFAPDIRSIYVDAFARIALSRRVVESWPSEHALSELVLRTGNLPVFAVSIIKFVDNPQYSPTERLEQVLKPASSNSPSEDTPFAQVDLMYTEILSRAVTDQDGTVDLEGCSKLRRMLRALVAVYPDGISINDLSLLLRSPYSAIQHEVDALSSVLTTTTMEGENGQTTTKIFHTSFRDFLMERCADDRFFIGDDQQLGDMKLLEDLETFVNDGDGYHRETQHSADIPEAIPSSPPARNNALEEMTADQLQVWLDANLEHPLRPPAVRRLVKLASQEDRIIPSGLLIYGVEQTEPHAVGEGAFAEVFKGLYQEEEVAIKRLRMTMTESDASKLMKRFYREAVIWRQLRHAQILSFLGVDGDALLENANAMGMVSPWMTQGTLLKYLRQPPQLRATKHRELIVNIAAGLGYLHAQPFVHGDLHDSNVFINNRHEAILGDFGLTAIDDPSDLAPTTTRSNHTGAIRWLSPELITFAEDSTIPPRKTAPGDIFAFGRLCLAVYTRSQPWHNIPNDFAVILKVAKNEHPSRPSEVDCHGTAMPDELWELIVRCWRTDYKERPNIQQVISTLQVIEFGMT